MVLNLGLSESSYIVIESITTDDRNAINCPLRFKSHNPINGIIIIKVTKPALEDVKIIPSINNNDIADSKILVDINLLNLTNSRAKTKARVKYIAK